MKKYCFVLNSFSLKKILTVFAVSSMFAFSGTVFGQEADAEMKTDQNQTEQAVPEASADTSTDTPVVKPDGDYPPMMSIEYIKQFCAAWNEEFGHGNVTTFGLFLYGHGDVLTFRF